MAGPFGSPFGNAFGSPFSNPFGSSTSSTPDEIFQKQMETMVNTLSKAGIDTKKVDQRTWLEKLFSVLNTPLAATTSMTSAAFGPKTLPEALGNIKDTWTGKKAYGTTELLNEAFGKNEGIGRKVAAFGLGIPMDPLTWLPLGKIAGAVSKPLAKGIKAIPGGAGKLDELTDIASGVKKFFGYDDFAKYRAKDAVYESMWDEKLKKTVQVLKQPAQKDTREAMRQAVQAARSRSAIAGRYLDEYKAGVEKGGLLTTLDKLSKDEKYMFNLVAEPQQDAKLLALSKKVPQRIRDLAEDWRKYQKVLGDEQVKLGLIQGTDDVIGTAKKVVGKAKRKLPERIGGETSEGYIEHVLNPEFKAKYPTLESLPPGMQKFAAPYYQVGSRNIYSRVREGSLEAQNMVSRESTGLNMLLDKPGDVLRHTLEKLADLKAQKDILEKLRGSGLLSTVKDTSVEGMKRAIFQSKGKGFSLTPDKMEEVVENIRKTSTQDISQFATNIPKGKVVVKNPLFKLEGKLTVARPELATIVDKLSEQLPGAETNKILKVTDKLTSLWKKLAITNPKFHINNWFGANINNMLDDFKGTIKNAPIVAEIMKGGSSKVYHIGEVSGTADEILKLFKDSGAISGFTKLEAFTKNPVDAISKISSTVGSKVETQARLTAFINNLKKGSSTSEALQRVFQIHGNYAPEAMSKFEKDVIKRVFPFYTWMKTSAPYQAQTLWNKTGIYSNLAHSQDIVKGDNNESIPDWLRQRVLLGTSQSKDGRAVARQFPISVPDLEMFANPAQVMLSKLNPLLKVPLEVGQNRDVFWGEKLYDPNKYEDDGSRVGKGKQALDYALKQIPMLTSLKSSGLFPKSNSVLGKEGYAQAELASLGIDENAITRIMAALAGQLDPTSPRIYDPAREKYSQQSAEAEMMRNLIGRLRRSGVIPQAK